MPSAGAPRPTLVRHGNPVKRRLAIGWALLALAAPARGVEFDVGRVMLRMSDDGWESIGTKREAAPYTGDRSGELPLVTRYLLLRDTAGKFRAALTAKAAWGVGSVRMTWTPSCKPQPNAYVVDNARGNLNRRDCLLVTKPIPAQRYLERTTPDMLSELNARKVALPATVYAVTDQVGTENGSYLAIQAVFASDFRLPTDGAGVGGVPDGVPAAAVAWGTSLAESVRRGAYSLSGGVVIPRTLTGTRP